MLELCSGKALLHYMSHSPIHTHSYTDGRGYHTGGSEPLTHIWQRYREQFRVKYPDQGHMSICTGGARNWTTDLPFSGWLRPNLNANLLSHRWRLMFFSCPFISVSFPLEPSKPQCLVCYTGSLKRQVSNGNSVLQLKWSWNKPQINTFWPYLMHTHT